MQLVIISCYYIQRILLIKFGTYVMKTDASKKKSFDLSSLSPELQKEVLLLEAESQAEIVKFVSI